MIPLMSIGWLALKELRDDAYRTAVNQIQDNLQLVTHAFQNLTATAEANAELLANLTLSQGYAQIPDETQSRESLQSYLLQLFNHYRYAFPELEEISLMFPDGFEAIRMVIANGDHVVKKEQTASLFERLSQTEADVITEIRRHPDTGKVGLYAFRRLFDPTQSGTHQNRPTNAAYLGLRLSLQRLYNDLEKYTIGQNLRILLINKNGEILHDTFGQATHKRLPVVFWKTVRSGTFLKRPRRYHLIDQTFLLQTKVVSSQLHALVAYPVSELEKPLKRPRIAVILATLSALILYTTLVYGGLQRIVLQPLKELNRATKEIAQGNEMTTVNISSHDELADLSSSIHQISEKLASHTDAADKPAAINARSSVTSDKPS